MVLGRRELGAILLGIAAIVFYLVLLSTTPSGAQTNNCPGAEVVDQFTGNADELFEEFDITGDSFLLTVETTVVDNSEEAELSIDIVEADTDDLIETFDVDVDSDDSLVIDAGPGTFFLDVFATDVDYTIDVDDCTGGTTNGSTTSPSTTSNTTNRNQYNTQNQNPTNQNQNRNPQRERSVINVPNKPLPPSGGLPVYGVVAGFVLTGAGLLALGFGIRRSTSQR